MSRKREDGEGWSRKREDGEGWRRKREGDEKREYLNMSKMRYTMTYFSGGTRELTAVLLLSRVV